MDDNLIYKSNCLDRKYFQPEWTTNWGTIHITIYYL